MTWIVGIGLVDAYAVWIAIITALVLFFASKMTFASIIAEPIICACIDSRTNPLP